MILRNKKLLIGLVMLFAYIGIGVFGLFKFNHMNSSPMIDCPYALNGSSVCDNGLDHINDWHQFSNVISPSFFIFSILILGLVLYFIGKQNFLNQKQYFYKWKYYLDNKQLYSSPNKIIRWLSLLENSPTA